MIRSFYLPTTNRCFAVGPAVPTTNRRSKSLPLNCCLAKTTIRNTTNRLNRIRYDDRYGTITVTRRNRAQRKPGWRGSAEASEHTGSEKNVDSENVEVSSPDFQEVSDNGSSHHRASANELKRFRDIKVVVSADLGRATVPIQTLMNLGEGSVLELNRAIDSPVELVVQGVPLASGEVVVVNGCFAVRITKVYENQSS